MAAEEDNLDVKEIEDTNPPAISEESHVEREPVMMDVGNAEDVVAVVSKGQEEINNEVPKPQGVTLRRHSTGVIGTKAGKPQVQSRYRGNYHGSSIHEFCKHGIGNKCDQADVVKPWKTMVKRKSSVEGSVVIKVETSALKRKSLGSVPVVTKPESSVAAKRDVLAVRKKPSASVNSESSSISETARSFDGSSNKSTRKNKETEISTLSGSAVVKKVSNSAMKKVSKAGDGESSKVCAPKNKEKAKTETITGEYVKEKTVRVVESSIKSVQSEKKPPSEKKTLTSGHKPVQIPGRISTGVTKKKETGSVDLEANPKPEKKIRTPKRTGVKVTIANHQLSFKRGKTLEPKPEDSSPKWLKFRKRAMLEQKTQTEGNKKNLKSVETKSGTFEGSKREKIVLRHRKVEGKKKMMTLFNNVIEETMTKLTKVRKDKVKALIGAFETVISLQDTKPSQKAPQSKPTTSASKVSPLVINQ